MSKGKKRKRHRPPPTLTQIETIKALNAQLQSNWPVPDNEIDARFLIDGLTAEARRGKTQRPL